MFELKRGRQRVSGKRKQVLILGGGFAGLYAALRLEKTLARDPDVEITLVNRDNFFLFTPMLHEVAASDLDVTDIVNPVRKLLRRVNFFAGIVESVDLENKRVLVSHGADSHQHTLPYDYLVLALGAITNFFDLPGLQSQALTMKSLGDALHLRNRMIEQLEEADFECRHQMCEPLLTYVVAGGGFAGVETVAAINDFLRHAIKFYKHLREDLLRVVLVHQSPVILPELSHKLGSYAQKKLEERKLEIRVNTGVRGMNHQGVELSDGTLIKTTTLIWTAGLSPHPLLTTLPAAKERGRLVVNEKLELQEWPGVWAIGDCAVIYDHKTGKPYSPTAQHAIREGKVVAHNVAASIRGRRKKAFNYSSLGQLAAIGRRTGVASILGVNFSGFPAWWLWRTIYLFKLPRLEKKLRVALNWTLDLFFTKDLTQFMIRRAPTVSQPENADLARETNSPLLETAKDLAAADRGAGNAI